ncbi:MAG: DUF1513 domain-containing protein, partial [Hyphomicrobiales bacterium]|nr:DUF1513 domain-containing protein [Hyphomicrobiales bacterium]
DLEIDQEDRLAMKGYCGSVAADRTGRVLAVSAPRGNRVVFWDLESGEYLEAWRLTDSCGIAAAAGPRTFTLTNGLGEFVVHDPEAGLDLARGDAGPAPWDNHLLAVTA